MIERDKVLKGLKACSDDKGDCKNCPYSYGKGLRCIAYMAKDALELLEEQKPLVKVDTYICLNCGHRLENQSMLEDNVIFNERYNFCPACGKKVKWND